MVIEVDKYSYVSFWLCAYSLMRLLGYVFGFETYKGVWNFLRSVFVSTCIGFTIGVLFLI